MLKEVDWICSECEEEAEFKWDGKQNRSKCCDGYKIREVEPDIDLCTSCKEHATFWEEEDGETLSSCCSAPPYMP